jgi:acetolactate synthase I/II/III large subunit
MENIMDNVTGAQLAVQALEHQGVEALFTLSGGHITPLYEFLDQSRIHLFDTRHEQAAVFMAEAYARLTRRPGVALVTAGPGFTNALTGVANARLANSPLVLISGCVGVECIEKLDLQDMRQAPVIEPMVKKALVCHKPERIPEFVDLAFRTAAGGRPGPVYLELPVDVLNAKPGDIPIKRPRSVVESHPVDMSSVEKALTMIQEADRPVIIAGSGVWYADAGDELTRLAELTNTPVFTGALGRGTIPDTHPLCFESSVAIRPGGAFFSLAGSDLVMIIGSRVNLFYLFGDVFPQTAKIIQVDIEPEEIGRNRSVDLPVFSDARGFLAAMNDLVSRKGLSSKLKPSHADWLERIAEAHENGKAEARPHWNSDSTPIHPMRLAREIDDFMSRDDDIVVADGGDTQIWMAVTRTARRAGHYLDSGLYGCLGVGLPYANAAKFIYPDKRVLLVSGDGSIGFNFMEFETAIRKNLPIVVVISNDLGWGMIRHSQELRLGRAIPTGTWIGPVDYHKMIEAVGGLGLYVENPADIRPALHAAFDSGKICCLNVMTDPTTVSPGSVALANIGGYKK